MSVLLPEDEKPAGPVTTSDVLGLPFMPQASNQAVAIYNALVRILDSSVLKKTGGSAADLTVEQLLSGSITSDHLTSTESTLTNITGTNATIETLTNTTGTINTLTTANASITDLVATVASIGTITVAEKVAIMRFILARAERLEADTATISTLGVSTATIDSASITNADVNKATIGTLTVTNLISNTTTHSIPVSTTFTFDPSGTELVSTVVGSSIQTASVNINRNISQSITLPFKPTRLTGYITTTFSCLNSGVSAAPLTIAAFIDYGYSYTENVYPSPSSVRSSTHSIEHIHSLVKPNYVTLDRTAQLYMSKVDVRWGNNAVEATAATLSRYAGGIDLSAVATGIGGNLISIQIVNPQAADATLNVGVDLSTKTIVVFLPTNAYGIITATSYTDIIAAINDDTDASSLVTATLTTGIDGSTQVTTSIAKALLSGATDATSERLPLFNLGFASPSSDIFIIKPGLTYESAFAPWGNITIASATVEARLEARR